VIARIKREWAERSFDGVACGTPVIASNIRGNPEVVRSHAAGLITESNTAEAVVGVDCSPIRPIAP
jgi:teichuronic acid biosynthesis glycosyltransferase TuaC